MYKIITQFNCYYCNQSNEDFHKNLIISSWTVCVIGAWHSPKIYLLMADTLCNWMDDGYCTKLQCGYQKTRSAKCPLWSIYCWSVYWPNSVLFVTVWASLYIGPIMCPSSLLGPVKFSYHDDVCIILYITKHYFCVSTWCVQYCLLLHWTKLFGYWTVLMVSIMTHENYFTMAL